MAIFALITFFLVFTISAITILRKRPEYIKKMSHLPLDDSIPQTSENAENEK